MSDTFYPVGFVLTGTYQNRNIYTESKDSFVIVCGDYNNKIITNSFRATPYRTLKTISKSTVKCYEEISSIQHGPNMSTVAQGAFWFGTAGALVGAAISQSNSYDIALEFKDGDKFLIRITVAGYYQEFKRIFYDVPTITQSSKPIIPSNANQNMQEAPVSKTESWLERAYIFLEDSDYSKADEYLEKVLDLEPKNAKAYVGKLLVDLRINDQAKLSKQASPDILTQNPNFIKAKKYGDEKLVAQLESYVTAIKNRIRREEENTPQGKYKIATDIFAQAVTSDDFLKAASIFEEIPDYMDAHSYIEKCYAASNEAVYQKAINIMTTAKNEGNYTLAANIFKSISTYKDSQVLLSTCLEKAEDAKKEHIRVIAKKLMTKNEINSYEEAISLFKSISGWKDADMQISICEAKLTELKEKEENERIKCEQKIEQERIQREREAKEKSQRDKKRKRLTIVCSLVLVVVIALSSVISLINTSAKKTLLQNSFNTGTFSSEFIIKNYRTLNDKKYAYSIIETEFEKCKKNNDAKKALDYMYALSDTGFIFGARGTLITPRRSIFFQQSYGRWLLDYVFINGSPIETQIKQYSFLDYYSYAIDGYSITFVKNDSKDLCAIYILTTNGWSEDIDVLFKNPSDNYSNKKNFYIG